MSREWKYERLCTICGKPTTPDDSFGTIETINGISSHERVHYECDERPTDKVLRKVADRTLALRALEELSDAWSEAVVCLADFTPDEVADILAASPWDRRVCELLTDDVNNSRDESEEDDR